MGILLVKNYPVRSLQTFFKESVVEDPTREFAVKDHVATASGLSELISQPVPCTR